MVGKSSSYSDKNGPVKNGTIEIKNGQIIVTSPVGGGKAAVLVCGKGVKFYVNDIEVRGSSTVFEDSRIKIEIEDKKPERKFEVTVGENNLTALVSVEYVAGEKYGIIDKHSANEVVINTVLSEKISCPHYDIEEALTLLREKGIIYGIDEEKLHEAIIKGSECPVVIARGQDPEDGTDDRFDVKYEENQELVEVNDRVDFYSIGKVVSVAPGEFIAEKIPGSEGKPGYDVFGKSIKPKRGRKMTLKAGKGARLSEDGIKAYSNIEGRPELRGDIISVHEVYEVPKDVSVATGNIEFIGDVVIKGSIMEGMKVKAGNNVVLYGSVTNGEITAGGDVTIYKNVISSRINAGFNDFLRYGIIDLFGGINKVLTDIFSAVGTLKKTGKVPKLYNDGQIIKLLIDTKYSQLTGKISELRKILTDNRECIDTNTVKVGAAMVKYFTGKGPTLIDNYFMLKDFIDALENQVEELKDQLKKPSNILAHYVQNSSLTTSGSIMIKGKGCYTSELECRGDIIINKKGSVTRGGSLSAGGDVKVYELGSSVGAFTNVSAGKEHAVYCEIAHVNSTIKVGEMSNKLDASVKKLKAYLYKGELMVEKSKM